MPELVELDWTPEELSRLLAFLKDSDKVLAKSLRKNVRNAAKIVQADVARAIMAYPAQKYHTGMREELAGSLAVRINSSTKSKRTGVQIVSNGRLLPQQKKALVKAMNAADTFRHPVWHGGNTANGHTKVKFLHRKDSSPKFWIEQKGMRYFRSEVVRQHESSVAEMIGDAISEILEEL
jgi:hypothetical protein